MLSLLSFREFPWQNGIVLRGSRMHEDVVSWLALEPKQYPEISHNLLEVSRHQSRSDTLPTALQGQARHLGSLDLEKMFKSNARKRAEVRKILNTPRAQFLRPELTPSSQPHYMHDDGTAAHVLLQFLFFDRLMDSVGYPSNPSRPNYPKVPLELSIPANLTKVQY
jgi:hypothetical protein